MTDFQWKAKQFFADRVIRQAALEGATLSGAERAMLFWSESDPAFTGSPMLEQALAGNLAEEEYEAKMCGLLARAYASDLAYHPRVADEWRQEQTVLAQGDHYMSIMIERVLDAPRKPWWQFWL
jgi:hypothetical protein